MQNSGWTQDPSQPGVDQCYIKKNENIQKNIAASQQLLNRRHSVDPLDLFRLNKPSKCIYLQLPTSQRNVPTDMTALDKFLKESKPVPMSTHTEKGF